MNRMATLLLIALAATAADAVAAETGPERALALPVVRLAVDEAGKSYFAETRLPLNMQDYSPPANPIAVHRLAGARSATFVHLPAGADEPWHPAPRRQYAVALRGEVEITAGSGEQRHFGPGDIVLLEDTYGQGHRTRVLPGEDHLALMVAVEADP